MNVIDFPLTDLCDARGCLKPDLGRYDRESGTPLARDTLHLDKRGLRILAKTFKTMIVGKSKRRSTGQQGGTSDLNQRDGHQPSSLFHT